MARKLKINLCKVQMILKKDKEKGSEIVRSRSGRPLSTTPREDRALTRLRLSLNNRRETSRILKRDFDNTTSTSILPRTVRRRIQIFGLSGCVAAKKPICTASHRKEA